MHVLDRELHELLNHSGVKGQKWGVRRDNDKPGGADGKRDKSDTKSRAKKTVKVKSGQLNKHEVVKKHGKTPVKTAVKRAAQVYAAYWALKHIVGYAMLMYISTQA